MVLSRLSGLSAGLAGRHRTGDVEQPALSSANKTPRRIPTRKADVPLIGSLMRLPREYIVARMLAEVHRQGFDVSQTELGVFMFPGRDLPVWLGKIG
jgi:hypothetical protein